MSLVQALIAGLFEVQNLVAIIVALVAAYVINFLRQVWTLPPGPMALPVVGNLPQLNTPGPMYKKVLDWTKKYGDPMTVWVGARPTVVASTNESFKDISGPLRNQVAGRMQSRLGEIQERGQTDVINSDIKPSWDVLRRLVHVAIRKYAQTETLAELVARQVDSELEDRFKKDSPKVRAEIVEYVEDVLNNVVAVSAFGESFRKSDPDYDRLQLATKAFEEEAANGLPSDILWILGFVFYKREQATIKAMHNFFAVTDKMFNNAAATFVSGKTRHFTDTLLNAREEFIAEDRSSAKYLTDGNLRQAMFDVFAAGITTSKTILSFALLILANDPTLQEELREEVLDALGPTNACTNADRTTLPKLYAFIQEVVRFFPPAPLGVPRKAMVDCKINGRFVPEGTAVLMNMYAVNRDPVIWGSDADTFNPKRFLTATKEQISKGVLTFGTGARACVGEKMAQADIMYAIARTLQKVQLSCPGGPGTANLESISADLILDSRRQDIDFTLL